MCVVGARPNFMKMAPLMAAFRHPADPFDCTLVHTGQHYDIAMSDVFFSQLGMSAPDIQLGIGPGTHGSQTGRMMAALETVVRDRRPDLVLVVGDVNSTLAATLVAAKAGVPVAHVEAGLRSFDRRMPEEINRVVTDALATYLFATEEDGVANLRREGVQDDRIFLVGNVMIDTLMALMPGISRRRMAAEMSLTPGQYGVVTLHRPSNVDDQIMLQRWVSALERISSDLPLVFPAHPRTAARLGGAGLDRRLAGSGVRVVEPLPYVEFISLIADSRLVLTDSGGIQEETTVLGIPCLTLRESTERPVTVELGTNTLVGTEPEAAFEAVERALSGPTKSHTVPPLWDGRAAERIAQILRGMPWTAYLTNPAMGPRDPIGTPGVSV
jgi:UDP-N-acetylglucosamine 2-epimerase (non-hydrolysing)